MSQNNQVSAKESKNLVSGEENAFKSTQRFQALMLGPFNLIHRSAESSFQLVNRNTTYNTELWNGDHHILSLSNYSRYLETNAKILSLSFKHLTYFIKKCSLRGQSVNQFPTILGVGSYIWNLLQAISEAKQDYFKVLSQYDTPTLVEVIRTIYGPDLVPIFSPNIEIAGDVPEAKEVAFTLVFNKKHKGKSKATSKLEQLVLVQL